MNATDLFSYMYVLLAEEVGSRSVLEEQIDKYMASLETDEFMNSPDRFAPDRQLPAAEAEQMKAAMALGGMARPRQQ